MPPINHTLAFLTSAGVSSIYSLLAIVTSGLSMLVRGGCGVFQMPNTLEVCDNQEGDSLSSLVNVIMKYATGRYKSILYYFGRPANFNRIRNEHAIFARLIPNQHGQSLFSVMT
jgi:hypothetical protein